MTMLKRIDWKYLKRLIVLPYLLRKLHSIHLKSIFSLQNLVQAKKKLQEEKTTLREGLDRLHFFIDSLKS